MATNTAIVVAADSLDTQSAIRALGRAGYRVEVARDARAGAAKLQRDPYDLVLVDWLLPDDEEGCELVRRFRAELPRAIFVLLSSMSGPVALRKAAQLGVDELVRKPIVVTALLSAIGAAEERRRRAPPPSPRRAEGAPVAERAERTERTERPMRPDRAEELDVGVAPSRPVDGEISYEERLQEELRKVESGGFEVVPRATPEPSRSSGRWRAVSPPPAGATSSSAAPLLQSPAWRNAGSTIGEVLSSALGVELKASPAHGQAGELHTALSMVDAEHLIELAIMMFVSRASGQTLAGKAVRASRADDALVCDLLAEACNNVLGALKTAMREEGHSFTLGVPTSMSTSVRAELLNAFTARSALAFRSSDAEIGVVLAVRQTQAIAVAVAQLAEGMVVVENVYAGAATLIVSSGTRLSSTTIDRLARQLPSRTVQICRTLRFP